MAASTATPTINAFPNGVDNTARRQIIDGTVAISASPGTYVTNGLPISFVNEQLKVATAKPAAVSFSGLAGYVYVYDYAHATIRIFETGNATTGVPLQELANALAMPAGVSGDTITFHAEFPRAL